MRHPSNSCTLVAMAMLLLGCSKTAAADPVPPQPSAPLPAEVAGFRFGMTVPEFEEHCKKVGKPNPLVGNDADIRNHTCDGVEVEPGMRLNVFLGFCQADSRLCEIDYWTDRNAALAFSLLNAKLVKRYGPPTDVNDTLREDGLEDQCAKGAEGKIRRTWWWGKPTAVTGRLLLAFSCKAGKQSVNVYVDDQLGAAGQIKYAKGKGVWPF
ncbi:MAG: hypothetical protein JWP87_4538 [Labilithrix sp.]|nr:hypothetical protein [Labilithrix sp.]